MKNALIWRGGLIFLGLTSFLFIRLHQEFGHAFFYGTSPTYDAEDRVNLWLLSAACFQKSGIPLVLCGPDRQIRPIEDVPIADDRGHVILATAAAFFRSSPVTRVTLVKINLCINAVGLLLLAGMWMAAEMPWSSVLTIVLGCRYGLPGPVPGHDAPASYFGVFCLIASVVVWIASYDFFPKSKLWIIAGTAVSFLSLAWACLLRQPMGLAGALTASFLLLCAFFSRPSNRLKALKKLLIGGFLISMAMCVTPAVLKMRNLIYRVPESHFYQSHGVWHSLYLGLGWVPNRWGIVWDDRYGAEAVKRIDPSIPYGSNDYFKTMKKLYLNLWIKNPGSVLSVYAEKFRITWNFPLLILGVRISRWFLLTSGLAALLYRNASRRKKLPLKLVLSLGLLYFMLSMQGVLGIPTGTHLYPLKFCVLLMVSIWADYFWRGRLFFRFKSRRLSMAS